MTEALPFQQGIGTLGASSTLPNIGIANASPDVFALATLPAADHGVMAAMQGMNGNFSALQGMDVMQGMSVQQPPAKRQRTFFKSRICNHYQMGSPGSCTMGAQCAFAHGEHELGTLATQNVEDRPGPPPRPLGGLGPSGPVKTKMCTYFTMGTCTRGSKCTFAHGEQDLGTPYDPSFAPGSNSQLYQPNPANPAGMMPGIDLTMDAEKGKVPHESDELVRAELERLLIEDPTVTEDFMKFCNEQMGFGGSSAESAPGVSNNFRFKKSRLCNNWEGSGYCPRGDLCNFAHGREQLGLPQPGPPAAQKSQMYQAIRQSSNVPDFMLKKTKLCTFFQAGNCQRGETCAFAHGEHELGAPQTGDISVQAMQKIMSGEGKNHTPTFNGLEQGTSGAPPQPTGDTFLGIIKSYNDKNAFGFIASEECTKKYGGDCFFPGKFVRENPGLNIGDMIEFEIGMSNKGQPQAIAIRPFKAGNMILAGLPDLAGMAAMAGMTGAPGADATSPAIPIPPMPAVMEQLPTTIPTVPAVMEQLPTTILTMPAVMEQPPTTLPTVIEQPPTTAPTTSPPTIAEVIQQAMTAPASV